MSTAKRVEGVSARGGSIEILKGLLLLALFGAACAILPAWIFLWLSLRRRPMVGRVLRTPIEDIYTPRGNRANRYRLLVDVDGKVVKLDVTRRSLWVRAQPGQLLKMWTIWGTVAKVEMLEPATPENVIRAARALDIWKSNSEGTADD